MNVNYIVRVFDVHEKNVAAETVPAGQRHWIPLERTADLALTGLARKILRRAHLLPGAGCEFHGPAVTRSEPSQPITQHHFKKPVGEAGWEVLV